MRPIWLIEAGVFGADAERLMAEVRRQGMTAEAVSFDTLSREEALSVGGRKLAYGDCVLGYGTFPFCREIQLHRQWKPGAFCTAESLDCTAYFAYYGRFLLNQEYAILPGVEAIRQQQWLDEKFGRDGEVFVRPTGPHKLFTGRCIYCDEFAAALAPTRYDPATLVVVAAPRDIGREWRLVVAEGQIIAASQYAEDGSKAISPGCPPDVRKFAEAMLEEVFWQPDPVFLLDVCESDGRLWLVEINGFSCSGLYACDLAAVVPTASRQATEVWAKATASVAPRTTGTYPAQEGP